MLRKLIFFLSVVVAINARAQNPRENPVPAQVKATQKPADTQIDYKKVGAPMPDVRLIVFRDSADARNSRRKPEVLTNEDLYYGANVFIMIFNPTCSHCQDETAMLEQNISLFDKSKLILSATPQMTQYVSDFYKLLHVKDYPQITVGVDSADYMNKTFLYQMLPQINIYNKKHKLVKIFTGDVAIDSLKPYIQ